MNLELPPVVIMVLHEIMGLHVSIFYKLQTISIQRLLM